MNKYYKHYKGNVYEILNIAMHTETEEHLVIYKRLFSKDEMDDGVVWARPFEMFHGTVEIDGETIPRFEKVEY